MRVCFGQKARRTEIKEACERRPFLYYLFIINLPSIAVLTIIASKLAFKYTPLYLNVFLINNLLLFLISGKSRKSIDDIKDYI